MQGAIEPPTFTLFATRRLAAPYLRYIERRLREIRPRVHPHCLPCAPARLRTAAVPWCDQCDEMVEDERLGDGGACPKCGTVLEERSPVPWHFRLMIVATVVYLGYRAYQGVAWLVHHG